MHNHVGQHFAECEICGVYGPVDVDHDHRTDSIRGYLCKKCNKGLGHFNDDPTLLSRAAEYVISPPVPPGISYRQWRLEHKRRAEAEFRKSGVRRNSNR